jgi:hypothetical protein
MQAHSMEQPGSLSWQQPCRESDTSALPELRAGPSLAADSTLALSAIWILALFDCTTALEGRLRLSGIVGALLNPFVRF